MTQHLMGLTEVAEFLGLSRQRVHQLTKTDPTFPAPAAKLSAGLVWETKAIKEWARQRGRN